MTLRFFFFYLLCRDRNTVITQPLVLVAVTSDYLGKSSEPKFNLTHELG